MAQEKRKYPSWVHSGPAFKEYRKSMQGINATTKGSIEKSKRRMAEKMAKKKPGNSHEDMLRKHPALKNPHGSNYPTGYRPE